MFKIQLNNPKTLNNFDENDSNVEEALQSIFPLETEKASLQWNDFSIALNYKYDVFLMINDFIRILNFINEKHSESLYVCWVSSDFSCTWHLTKDSDEIKIKWQWNEENSNENIPEMNDSEVKVKIQDLKREVENLKKFLKKGLEKNGYNSSNLEDFIW